jgi:16S rRNA (adenine1518-N6/adenine1519-N6)-dimethyltransferase
MDCSQPPRSSTPGSKSFSPIAPRQKELGLDGNGGVEAGQMKDGFIDFLKLSFGQKRKTLWNNLKANYPEPRLRAALAQARVKPAARAETLTLEESAALFRALRANHDGS